MNPFINPEFWLSLAFIIVMGLIFFSPVRHAFARFFNQQRQLILDQQEQANNTLNEAQKLLKESGEKSVLTTSNQQLKRQLIAIQTDFNEKTTTHMEAQKQDFKIRKNMASLHLKNNLRTELLDKVQKQVLKTAPKKSLEKDLAHLVSLLKENRNILEQMKTP